MARVTIDSGPVTADLYLRNVPPDKWHALMLSRRTFLHTHLPYDCRELLRFIEEAEQMYEPLGFASVADFIRRGFDLEPEQVDWAIEGLRRFAPDEAMPYLRAVELGKKARDLDDKDRRDQRPAGRPAKAESLYNNETDIQDYKAPTGTSAAAALRRLRKDRPDIHARVLAGEITPHAGMVEAGFRKRAERKPLSALERIKKLLRKLTAAERDELRRLLR
jgi:hypothetical protein